MKELTYAAWCIFFNGNNIVEEILNNGKVLSKLINQDYKDVIRRKSWRWL